MGMYTELIFGAELDGTKLSKIDLDVLKWMFDSTSDWDNPPLELPDHPFFKCYRWKAVTKCGSYYFAVNSAQSDFWKESIPDYADSYVCTSRANLKNYDNEIEKFLDYVRPFIEQGSGSREFYAIVCYEEQDEPTIYYLREKDEQ